MSQTNQVPDLKDRIQALFIDLIIVFAFSFIITKIFDQMTLVSDDLRMFAFITIFLVYDPLLTSFLGGTLGHRAMNLRVKRASDETKNIMFITAIIRFVFKSTLGIISLLTVSINSKGNAIHDMVTGSVVIVNPKK